MRINHNIPAMLANNQLLRNENSLSKSLERLSSGLKINSASDDAAGLAIANKMRTQIEGLEMASRNGADGISVIETAEGALTEVHSMLQRMRELAVQAGNETNGLEDREAMQEELNQMVKEIDRISRDTEFNRKTLLDGSQDVRIYTDNRNVKVTASSDYVPAGIYKLDFTDGSASFPANSGFPVQRTLSRDQDKIVITDDTGFSMELEAGNATGLVTIEVKDMGTMPVQIGSNEGQIIPIRIPDCSASALGVDELDLTSTEKVRESIISLDKAIARVSETRSRMGAVQNRLEHAISSVDVSAENITGALSRIQDVDMAKEMTTYTQYTVLTQAATSVLAQANDIPQQVLQLLQ